MNLRIIGVVKKSSKEWLLNCLDPAEQPSPLTQIVLAVDPVPTVGNKNVRLRCSAILAAWFHPHNEVVWQRHAFRVLDHFLDGYPPRPRRTCNES